MLAEHTLIGLRFIALPTQTRRKRRSTHELGVVGMPSQSVLVEAKRLPSPTLPHQQVGEMPSNRVVVGRCPQGTLQGVDHRGLGHQCTFPVTGSLRPPTHGT